MDSCSLMNMKIKEAMDRSVRSRHVGNIMDCLKHKDGLTSRELYTEYCKRCKEEEVEAAVYNTINTVLKSLVFKGALKREYYDVGLVRFWMVR